MASLLFSVLIGISSILPVIENTDRHEVLIENREIVGTSVGILEKSLPAYRRFVPEHQMWCARGPEVSIALKTNLPYWLVATPNAGIEMFWRRRWSFSIEGVYASWLFDQERKFYYLAGVSSEFRYWFRKDGRFNSHHIGAALYLGQYDMQFKRTGEQADFKGIGITYGYSLPVNQYFNIEFGIGIGCISRDYLQYEMFENEFARTGNGQKTWFGPTKISISGVWHIGNKQRGKK